MSGSTTDNAGRQSGVIAAAAAGIEIVSSDPSAEHGKVWFNSTTSLLKVYNNVSAWASMSAITEGRTYVSGVGTASAGLTVGGSNNYGSNYATAGYEWNGSSWSGSGALNTASYNPSCGGTQTSTIACGGQTGSYTDRVESYNGASWSEESPTFHNDLGWGNGCGSSESASLLVGGNDGSTKYVTSKSWNGTAFASEGDLATGVYEMACTGTEPAALTCAGANAAGDTTVNAEEYNGSSWSAGGNLTTARGTTTGQGQGSQTDALVGGGKTAAANPTQATEVYNGTAWSTSDNFGVATKHHLGTGGHSSSTNTIMGSGYNGSGVITTMFDRTETLTARSVTAS